jgi:diguanylate cyclase
MKSTPTSLPVAAPQRPHWIVRNNYRLRTGAFAISFLGIALHVREQAAPATWVALGLLFLVYPHLVYWRACRAADSQTAELANLVLDSLLLGAALAALHFPLWPSFTLCIGSLLNSAICGGSRSLSKAALGLVLGVLLSVSLFGFGFAPETDWPTTAMLIVGTSVYLVAIGLASNWRNQQLRLTREKLRLGEQALSETNDRLQQQITEIQRLQAQLNEQAIRDPLTGLFNRRYLETIVPHELARCAREGTQLTLMMMDIDHFKSVNDRFGHQGGDEVLKALGELLNSTVRGSDVACRYGGEEFLLLLPNMPAHCAAERAEQWRAAFAAMTVAANDAAIRATLSIGVAIHPRDGHSLHELIRAADLALYRAKSGGRDRVAMADAEGDPPAPHLLGHPENETLGARH